MNELNLASDLRRKATAAHALADALEAFARAMGTAPAPEEPPVNPVLPKRKPYPTDLVPIETKPARKRHERTGWTMAGTVRRAIADLPQPFDLRTVLPVVTQEGLEHGLTLEQIRVSTTKALLTFREQDLLRRAGPGIPTPLERTAKFPAAAAAAQGYDSALRDQIRAEVSAKLAAKHEAEAALA
jgi:hypothetical protein